MIKDLIRYLAVFGLLFIVGYSLHDLYLTKNDLKVSFSITTLYLFNSLFSWIVCVHIRFIATLKQLSKQVGFIYLTTIMLKFLVFGIVFYEPVFLSTSFQFLEKMSLLIPIIGYILVEAYLISDILSKKTF